MSQRSHFAPFFNIGDAKGAVEIGDARNAMDLGDAKASVDIDEAKERLKKLGLFFF